jgi:ketosteroid isomerase-like protein
MGNDEIGAVLDAWTAAEVAGDSAALDRLLADDFAGIGPLGFMLPKQAWLGRFTPSGLNCTAFSFDAGQVRHYGDAAIVTGQQHQAGTYQGNRLPFGVVRAALVLLCESDRWRIAGIHLSFIAGTPGAPSAPAP